MATLAQPDDNLIPGATYTFQLNLAGFQWPPSASTVQTALTQNAPSFLGSLQVTSPSLTTLYNCQFTYTGDGTDVVSDVANELIAALQTGTNDTFTFVGAVPDTASTIIVSPGNAAQQVADSVGTAINNATQGAAKTVATAAQSLLTPIELAVVIVVVLVGALIFTAGKSGGVSADASGLKIGG